MKKMLFFCLLVCLATVPAVAPAGLLFTSGEIEPGLKYEDFSIGQDGNLTGAIVNTSNKLRPAFRLDLWTTDMHETRVLWRKSLHIGSLPPGGRFTFKEPYDKDYDSSLRIKFSFRIGR